MTYLDTNIIIYLLEKHDIYSELVAQTLEELSENNGSFITSTITITEFLAGTTSSDLSTLHRIPKLTFILLEEEVAEQAALLQRKNKLQIGDAIHLATALSQNTDLFFSNDKELNKVVSDFITIRQL
jgi:predicted nucleic acid-binding protein